MEPGVIRMFSSSPPPMDDVPDEEEDEFGDFGTFSAVSGVPTSISFSELDTPTTFNQTQALNATSPPDFALSKGVIGVMEGGRANGHLGRLEKSLKGGQNSGQNSGQNIGQQTEVLTNGFQGSPTLPKSAPFSQDNEGDFADFSAFSDKVNPDLETLDDKQSCEFKQHNAVKEETSNSNRTEFANFAAFSEDSGVTLDDKQSETVSEERGSSTQKDPKPIPNRTEPVFTDFGGFSEDCTLENSFTGSETVSKDEDIDFYFKKDETWTQEDCSSLNGNALDASGSVCSSDLASESDCGIENAENSRSAVVMNGTAEKDKDGGSETETETSFGRPLSTEALEEFGDMSTTGSVPSPQLQEETATPTGDEEFGELGDCLSAHECGDLEQNHPQKAQGHDDEEEDDFGDFNSPEFKTEEKNEFSTSQSFGNFFSSETLEKAPSEQILPPNTQDHDAEQPKDEFDDFGDFNSPKFKTNEKSNTEFPESESFGNFSSAATDEPSHETQPQSTQDPNGEDEDGFGDFGDFNAPTFKTDTKSEAGFSATFGHFGSAVAEEEVEAGWSAFGNEDAKDDGSETWAAFRSEVTEEPTGATSTGAGATGATSTGAGATSTGAGATGATSTGAGATSTGAGATGATSTGAGATGATSTGAGVNTASLSERLQQLFGSSFPQMEAPVVDEETPTLRLLLEPHTQTHRSLCVQVWAQVEDIHEALGLRFQWGGSCCNKALLCSLGIDTRNILFTGQKKQPVIVPMYAAGLGMLEPVKPVSAAEMIASIAHNSPCSPESVQEALPPVQFDWSSSGLTNPLDASGGSSLLNLDFFGPVEDSESGAGSIPGVDPELFELTTAKMDSSKMTDAFARLMSTVQSTSTTRKPRRDENLTEEALKVISRFPDLSFMTAKVLMFPTTLTPHGAPETEPESRSEPETRSEPGSGSGSGSGLENGAD
ncbi:aftiphilin a isoform X2 [Periophthalmus magnuspinnatus]|uniref:aftiphilin a isoform X2 n=1 Tax=Periophthalmus magnuspinnatus TaxID=409849 RepID=UPI00145A1667|nr:aftiphilin a isoform X2 [Periophthalmus magnuspinnatus]